jgi:TonB family protein
MRHVAALAAALLLASGIAGAAPRTPARQVGEGLHTLVTQDDYPVAALRLEEQGLVRVRLDIDTKGRVSRCTILVSSRSPSLDATTCRVLEERARFAPARDRRGRAVPDQVNTSVDWRLHSNPNEAAVQSAATTYLSCLEKTARPLASSRDTDAAIADKAFAACTEQERALLTVIASPEDKQPSAEPLRRSIRPQLLERIRNMREGRPL